MRSARSFLLLVMGGVLTTACGSSSGTTDVQTITINDFVGSWSATSEVFRNTANPSETFDLIGAGGDNRFTMLTGGAMRTWIDLATFHDEWDAQVTLNSDTNTLTATPVEASRPVMRYTFALDGNTLTLTSADAHFDFTLSGADGVPATVVAVFTKTG